MRCELKQAKEVYRSSQRISRRTAGGSERGMARSAFYSFHYTPDCWRASQVRNMGVIDGNKPASDNDWEQVTRRGDQAIQNWIEGQLNGRSCAIVLIGQNTAARKWINYEISTAWNQNKGVLGVYVHRLRDASGYQCNKGGNPFDHVTFTSSGRPLSTVVQTYDTPYDSKEAYGYIQSNLSAWIEEAIRIRASN